jgi:hypothetical protein
VERYAHPFAARKHDQFLIPAGTIHACGAGALLLEIGVTPDIFGFKMRDWARLGLERNAENTRMARGIANPERERGPAWTRENLVNRIETFDGGRGMREERTGLHDGALIETRRHWFSKTVAHHTCGGVNVLNLVEGEEAIMESPEGAFEPFIVRRAETVVIPAAVGHYNLRPHGPSAGKEIATLKAFIRA